jgi:hypothetical protein
VVTVQNHKLYSGLDLGLTIGYLGIWVFGTSQTLTSNTLPAKLAFHVREAVEMDVIEWKTPGKERSKGCCCAAHTYIPNYTEQILLKQAFLIAS